LKFGFTWSVLFAQRESTKEKAPYIFYYFHFFCPSKRNETKKKRPEMITFAWPYARYTSHIGATGQSKVRAISGLPTRRYLYNSAPTLIIQFF
jgi:hypothetical protein